LEMLTCWRSGMREPVGGICRESPSTVNVSIDHRLSSSIPTHFRPPHTVQCLHFRPHNLHSNLPFPNSFRIAFIQPQPCSNSHLSSTVQDAQGPYRLCPYHLPMPIPYPLLPPNWNPPSQPRTNLILLADPTHNALASDQRPPRAGRTRSE
jgi:hypothetical protein